MDEEEYTRDDDKIEYIGPFVSIYLVDLAYGGPEEGGWWYRTRQLIRCKQYATRDEAEAAREDEMIWCEETNRSEGRREISSVLSTGRYVAYIEDEPGADFPDQIPHYE
jgi:hypothetical protein